MDANLLKQSMTEQRAILDHVFSRSPTLMPTTYEHAHTGLSRKSAITSTINITLKKSVDGGSVRAYVLHLGATSKPVDQLSSFSGFLWLYA